MDASLLIQKAGSGPEEKSENGIIIPADSLVGMPVKRKNHSPSTSSNSSAIGTGSSSENGDEGTSSGSPSESDHELDLMISELRAAIVEEFESLQKDDDEELPYDERDIARIKDESTPWHVERYLVYFARPELNRAKDLMRAALKWRKEFKVCSLSYDQFPREFFQSSVIHRYVPDKHGNIMIYSRARLYRKFPFLLEWYKRFFIWGANKVDLDAGGRKVAIVFDLQDAGLSNTDIDLMWFLVQIKDYFPSAMSYVFVHGLPFVLQPFFRLIVSWLPQQYRAILKTGNSEDLKALVGEENLPHYLNGTCDKNFHVAPASCPSLDTFLDSQFGGDDATETKGKLTRKERDRIDGYLQGLIRDEETLVLDDHYWEKHYWNGGVCTPEVCGAECSPAERK